MDFEFNNLDEALIGMSNELLSNGVERKTRGFSCVELPEPIKITINNPTLRIIKNPERAWSKTLPCAESIWLLNGVNFMKLPGKVTKNLYNFSDDGKYMRAGYGPRIRAFSGVNKDYEISSPSQRNFIGVDSLGGIGTVDQLRYVVETLIKDRNSRQASITIHDPVKDCFNEFGVLKETKDQPCTRLIQFEVKNNKLDCTVYMRSNDLLWGFSAVNVFNFTLMQEIVAGLIGINIGKYHHIVNNFHFYNNVRDKIVKIAESNFVNKSKPFFYNLDGDSFDQLDLKLKRAYHDSLQILFPEIYENPYRSLYNGSCGNDLLDDLVLQIYRWKNKSLNGFEFNNNQWN